MATTAQVRTALAQIRAKRPTYPSPGEDPIVPLLDGLTAVLDAIDSGKTLAVALDAGIAVFQSES